MVTRSCERSVVAQKLLVHLRASRMRREAAGSQHEYEVGLLVSLRMVLCDLENCDALLVRCVHWRISIKVP
eukprot:5543084-Prymnesium_polylepis.1